MRRVRVTLVEQLSPRMVRVTFTGDDLAHSPGTDQLPTSS
jgi:NADPH-dependent ferric siderophore reductase